MARPVLVEGWPRNAMTGGPKLTRVWWPCERQQGQFLQPLCGRKSLKSIYRKLPHSLIIQKIFMLLLVHKVRQLKRGWEGGAASPQTPGACTRDGLGHILKKALPLTPADTAPSLHTAHCQQQAGQADHIWASPLSAASRHTSHPQSILLWGKGEETAKKKNPGDSHRTHPHSAGELAPPGRRLAARGQSSA